MDSLRGEQHSRWLLAALLSPACAEPSKVFALLETDARYGFFAYFDDSGASMGVQDPILMPRGQVIGDSPIELVLEEQTASVAFLGLSEAALDASVPLLAESPERLTVSAEPWSCPAHRLEHAMATIRMPPPEDAAAFRYAVGDAGFVPAVRSELPSFKQLVLGFPVDFERCAPDTGALGAFSELPEILPGDATIAGLPISRSELAFDVSARIGNRLLVATNSALFLFEKGGVYIDDPSHAMRLPDEGPGVSSISIDRRPGLEARRFFLSGGPREESGIIHELVLDAEGFHLVATTTFAETLNGILVDSEGRVIAGGERGLVLTRALDASGFETQRVTGRAQVVIESPDRRRPHLIGSDSLFVGDAFAQVFDRFGFNDTTISTLEIRSLAVRRTETRLEVWAGGRPGVLGMTQLDGPIRLMRIDVGSELLGCTAGPQACGETSLTPIVRALAAHQGETADWIFALVAGCKDGVLVIEPRAGCARRIGLPPGRTPGPIELRGLELSEGWLTAVAGGGRVYELRLPD